MENVRNHRDIRVVTNDIKEPREPNYYATKWFSATEMKKTSIKLNKPIYL